MTQLAVEIRDENNTRLLNLLDLSDEDKGIVYTLFNDQARKGAKYIESFETYKVEKESGQWSELTFYQMVLLRRHSSKGVDTNKIRAGIVNDSDDFIKTGKSKIYFGDETLRVEQLAQDNNASYTKPLIKQEPFVVKFTCNAGNVSPEDLSDLLSEYSFARDYHNRRGVKLFFSHTEPPYVLVMPRAKGISIYQYLKKPLRFNLGERLTICLNIIAEFQRMHNEGHPNGFAHHDISTGNIFIDPATLDIKVIDFGNAEKKEQKTMRQIRDLIGTFPYAAPETLKLIGADRVFDINSNYPDLLAIDRYAIGVVLIEVITHQFIQDKMNDFFQKHPVNSSNYNKAYEKAKLSCSNYFIYYDDLIVQGHKFIFGLNPAYFNAFFNMVRDKCNLDQNTKKAYDIVSDSLLIFDPNYRESLAVVFDSLFQLRKSILGLSPSKVSEDNNNNNNNNLSV